MATPPTRVLSVTPTAGWSTQSTPKITPTFDVQAGDLLTLIAFSENESRLLGTPTWTGSGAWTAWPPIVVLDYSTAYLHTCLVTATATGRTVSLTATGGGSLHFGFIVTVWRNHGGVGVVGKANASGAPSLTLNCSANSAISVGNSDWNAVSGASRLWRSVNGTPILESSYGGIVGSDYINYTGYSLDAGPAGNKVVGLSAPTGQKYSIVAVEILGTTSSPSVMPAKYVTSGIVHTAEMFYWDGTARHDLSTAVVVP